MKGGYSGKLSESSGLMMQLLAGGGGVVVTGPFSFIKFDFCYLINVFKASLQLLLTHFNDDFFQLAKPFLLYLIENL